VLALIEAGFVVVANGGGGIPVLRREDGSLSGVEAVIDKDLGAALLGVLVGADLLIVATDVPQAVLHFGTPEAQPLGRVGLRRMQEYAEEGHFASGSMGPKVDAVCRFVQGTDQPAVITSLDRIVAAVTEVGSTGTVVVPD
jgi:carbamate kinase